MAGNDSYTKSLLHLNTDYADVAAGGTHTWTGYGNAQIDAAIKKFGAGSLLLDGDGDYIDTPDSADWAMGSGDFTVDFWMKRARFPQHEMLIGQCGPSGNNSDCGMTIYLRSAEPDVLSVLHMNGANNSTVFKDDGAWHTPVWTAYGNAKLTTTSPKFGSACGTFDGTGDYIGTPDSEIWNVGSGNFTFHFWLKRGGIGTVQRIFGQVNSAGSDATTSFRAGFNANNTFLFGIVSGTTFYTATSTGTITDMDTWHHIACVRDGNTLRLFIDGVADGTADVTGITCNNSAYKMAIGRPGELNSAYFNGQLDEWVYKKGTAIWTSNFTPLTSEYVYDRILAGFCYGANGVGVYSNTDISDTNWHHVALVRDGNTLRLFIDGIAEGTADVTGVTMNDVAYKMAIGAEGELAGWRFAGNVDEPRISKGIARSDFIPLPTDEYNGWTPPGGESFVSWID